MAHPKFVACLSADLDGDEFIRLTFTGEDGFQYSASFHRLIAGSVVDALQFQASRTPHGRVRTYEVTDVSAGVTAKGTTLLVKAKEFGTISMEMTDQMTRQLEADLAAVRAKSPQSGEH